MSETSNASNIPSGHIVETTMFQLGGRDLQLFQLQIDSMEKNYFKWSQIVHTLLKGRGKQKHILGNGLKACDPKFVAWDEEKSLIMVWLWNSMIPEISDTCLTLSTAQMTWEVVKQTYSKACGATSL